MADAQDFIPTEAKLEIDPAYFIDGVENLAGIEDIETPLRVSISDYENRFITQREGWAEDTTGIWNQCDAAFRSFANDSSVTAQYTKGTNDSDSPRANVGSTLFYRQVTQMAANGYAVQTSKDMPFKYSAVSDEDGENDPEVSENRAKKLNLLAKWSMKQDKFNLKSIDFWTQIKKYGNVPVMIEWKYKKGTKTIPVPVYNEEDPTIIDEYRFEEIDTIIENRPSITLLPIESVKADTAIGNIQGQECVIVSSLVGLSSIVAGIRDGFYREDLLKDLKKSHQWDGTTGFEGDEEKKDNRDLNSNPDTWNTGQYLKREVFINVPIDRKKWDIEKNIPVRYRVTMFGNEPSNSVIACIERNREPGDIIPIEMIHANPDDSDMLYHISPFEVIRPNLSTETTIIRQVIDNSSLVNKFVTWEVEGEVQGNDREFRAGQRFVVDTPNSMGQFQVRDISQSALGVLDYIKEDSNTANSLDKNSVGESYGARTSSAEAQTISGNSQRPNIVNIEYILEQYLGFIADRYKSGWETYGLKKQIIQITDEDDNTVFIRPTDISGEFDIVIDIMDEIKDDQVKSARRLNYIQTVASIPQLAATIDWVGISNSLAEDMMGTSKFVVGNSEGDAEDNAHRNIMLMLQSGTPPQMTDGMNLRKHLEIYKSERTRWKGYEDQNQYVESVLDPVIAQIEARIAQPPKQGGTQAQPEVGGNEAQRLETSGAMGGI